MLRLISQYNTDRPIIYTSDMHTWYTSRPHSDAKKSHINYAVYDSQWETAIAYELDRNPGVKSWVKNDHLGFEIHYIHDGKHHKYLPDYVVLLTNNTYIILEVKGKVTQQVKSKELATEEWIQAITEDKRFGKWTYAMSTHPKDLPNIIKKVLNYN